MQPINNNSFDDRWPGLRSPDLAKGSIQLARSYAELFELGRLRYQRFVVDQGQPYKSSSLDVPLLTDPVDEHSLNLYVRRQGSIAMAMRMSWASDVTAGDYLSTVLSQLDDTIRTGPTIICSRLIATDLAGDITELVKLFRYGYAIGLLSGCNYSILSTHSHRLRLFERFGYCKTGRILDDPIAGPQHVMLLMVRDLAHMTRVGSPFLPVAKRLLGEGASSRDLVDARPCEPGAVLHAKGSPSKAALRSAPIGGG